MSYTDGLVKKDIHRYIERSVSKGCDCECLDDPKVQLVDVNLLTITGDREY